VDELAKALAEAIRAGSSLAPSALIGYYAVRIIEALSAPLGFIGVFTITGYTIRKCVLRYADVEEKNNEAKREANRR
jgi:hypothetical protein